MANPAIYDPPEELEGANNGLINAVAARLWQQRTHYFHPPRSEFGKQSAQVTHAWRQTATDLLRMLFDMGFVGPAGPPRQDRFEGLTYAWVYEAGEWEIIDAEGGYVALVRHTPDLELMLAAPAMRAAIHGLLAALPDDHPVRGTPEMKALVASLPESPRA
jgi:hypothetical protein